LSQPEKTFIITESQVEEIKKFTKQIMSGDSGTMKIFKSFAADNADDIDKIIDDVKECPAK